MCHICSLLLYGTFGFVCLLRCEGKLPSQVEEVTLGQKVSDILNTIREGYDKRVRPNYGGEPVVVGVTMYILSISSLSEVHMDFTVDFYFRQTWTDPRLSFKGPPGVKTLSVGTEFLKTIWVPDTFFVNEKKSYFHTATTSNEFLRISESGDVIRSLRLTVTATCPMNLQYFPMDRQLCTVEIESFGYTMSDLRYRWAKGLESVGISSDVSLPQFKVNGHRQQAVEISLSSGNYSRLACEILFERALGFYIIQIYVPASLIVVISWISFWINRNATPARVALGVTTVLTMTTLMSSVNAALPKISYVKSLDVFLGTCFLMVFAALLEYATVGYMAKRIQMRKNKFDALRKKVEEAKPKGGDAEAGNASNPGLDAIAKKIERLWGVAPSDIDRYSRIVFPVCFICFQLMYWVIYLNISDVVEDDLVVLEQN
ncbi:gamma-aminobutyric acid receptor subunit beta isoform X2 [Folsomia candida]|uniref:gamma-aminobutyric acid receptor subunit beta isoform X2 n=1 Tax=Folsomia candida TaxID=158441 RepID=UPI000B8F5D48|nr:gamma-aminobutyric acid receptor subunit beta isoform X2 [Folsomia candida]